MAKKKAHSLLRRYLKGFIVRKEVGKELKEERELKRIIALENFLRRASQTDLERMN